MSSTTMVKAVWQAPATWRPAAAGQRPWSSSSRRGEGRGARHRDVNRLHLSLQSLRRGSGRRAGLHAFGADESKCWLGCRAERVAGAGKEPSGAAGGGRGRAGHRRRLELYRAGLSRPIDEAWREGPRAPAHVAVCQGPARRRLPHPKAWVRGGPPRERPATSGE